MRELIIEMENDEGDTVQTTLQVNAFGRLTFMDVDDQLYTGSIDEDVVIWDEEPDLSAQDMIEARLVKEGLL